MSKYDFIFIGTISILVLIISYSLLPSGDKLNCKGTPVNWDVLPHCEVER